MKALNKNFLSTFKYFFLLYCLFASIFSRSFVGLTIFKLRIGEIAIAFSFIYFIYVISLLISNKLISRISKLLISQFVVVILYFFILSFYTNSSLISPYTFRSSSYIWVIALVFLGNSLILNINNRNYIIAFQLLLIFIYLTGLFGVFEIVENFFLMYSDKFELHKGSDLALVFIIFNLIINKYFEYKAIGLRLFVVNFSLFLPLFLFKSRSAFIAVLVFVFYELFLYFKNQNFTKKNNLLIIIIFLLVTTFSTVLTQNRVVPESIDTKIITESYSSLGTYKFSKYKQDMPFLYIENQRIYSGDGNLNWRLDMWQDAIYDTTLDSKLYIGEGFKSKFKVFTVNNTGFGNDRTGLDKLNENLHNYFLNIFLRGGIIHLILVIYIFVYLYRNRIKNNFQMLVFYFSVFFISFFDASMENAHFPIIFYIFLGYFFIEKNKFSLELKS
jgi:hypothetical protein